MFPNSVYLLINNRESFQDSEGGGGGCPFCRLEYVDGDKGGDGGDDDRGDGDGGDWSQPVVGVKRPECILAELLRIASWKYL